MRNLGVLTIIGAVLPLALGATLGMIPGETGTATVAGPVDPTAFWWLSVGLAVSHLLVMCGYLGVMRLTAGAARVFAVAAAAGTAVIALVEIWAGLIAGTDADSSAAAALTVGYLACSTVIAVGTVGAGLTSWSQARRLAWPLLVNGLFLGLVAIPVRFLADDTLGILLLTLWGLTYIWLGVVLIRTDTATRQSEQRARSAA